MSLPFFYIDQPDPQQKEILLDENTSKHVVQVLRMKKGEPLNLTNGKGTLFTCSIANDNKKRCLVEIIDRLYKEPDKKRVAIAISLLKNTNRFEWFLEKAVEIGVAEIIPMICERTEKEKFRHERMNSICISAMLQSQQVWLPRLLEPVLFNILITTITGEQKLMAHCDESDIKKQLSALTINDKPVILIGPEGDFTTKEIDLAKMNGFEPVSLGHKRLRAETAGVVAAALLCT